MSEHVHANVILDSCSLIFNVLIDYYLYNFFYKICTFEVVIAYCLALARQAEQASFDGI